MRASSLRRSTSLTTSAISATSGGGRLSSSVNTARPAALYLVHRLPRRQQHLHLQRPPLPIPHLHLPPPPGRLPRRPRVHALEDGQPRLAPRPTRPAPLAQVAHVRVAGHVQHVA